jgi:hypothetical protein
LQFNKLATFYAQESTIESPFYWRAPIMLHHIIAVIALGVGGLDAGSQELARYDGRDQAYEYAQRRDGRFWVQFRQPEWRDYAFDSREEMDQFIYDKQRNGWDVEIYPRGLRVRYRLTQWGGSQIFDTLPEAEAWARHLERHFGYQPRIVDY